MTNASARMDRHGAEMREAGLPLYGLESGDPLSDFDIIAFTLQYELSFPTF